MGRKKKARILRLTLYAGVSFILVVSLFLLALLLGIWGNIPTKKQLRDIRNDLASEVHSAEGEIIGKYFFENRSNVSFDEIPQPVLDALVATEDIRFFEHDGIDRRSLMRVLFKTVLMGDEHSGGGSTISQQLIKNLYPRLGESLLSVSISKFKEMIAAVRLEKVYSKNEILVLYLNTVPFGDNTFGIKGAADHYFSKAVQELKMEEIAVLIGMLKGTALFNPQTHPENAINRRNVVLDQMDKYGFLKMEQTDSLKGMPLRTAFKPLSHHSGPAPYFREQLRLKMQLWCAEHFKENGEPYDLYRDGLRIFTTLDANLQRNAEEAMKRHLTQLQQEFDRQWNVGKTGELKSGSLRSLLVNSEYYRKATALDPSNVVHRDLHKKNPRQMFSWDGEQQLLISPIDSVMYNMRFLHAGVLAMNPNNGDIKVWVGGINHKYFQYDHVLSRRQVGSTFKPFVYCAALEAGVEPDDFYPNDSVVYTEYGNWTPANSNHQYGGEYSVLGALVHSVNTVSVKLAMESGLENVSKMAHRLGIETAIPQVPSMALGTAEIPLIEMVTAYAPFPNGGFRVEPRYLVRIEDRNGNVLDEFEQVAPVRVIDERVAVEMTHMLKMVADSGTAKSLHSAYGLKFDVAGKTGTTQSHADGWFIGYTPDLVTGVWVGADDPSVHFKTITYGQGSYMALPVFARMARLSMNDEETSRYFSGSFKMMDRNMAKHFACTLYRDKPQPANGIKNILNAIESIFVKDNSHTQKADSVSHPKSFFERLGKFFRKK